MLVEVKVFELQCDKCQSPYENAEGYIPHYHDKDEFKDDMDMKDEQDWLVIGEKAYCESCKKTIN